MFLRGDLKEELGAGMYGNKEDVDHGRGTYACEPGPRAEGS